MNEDYLKGIMFSEDIYFTNDMSDVFSVGALRAGVAQGHFVQGLHRGTSCRGCTGSEILIIAVPSHVYRETVKNVSKYIGNSNFKAIVNLTKGLEEGSLKRMSEILQEELSEVYKNKVCTLSGPSHAEEVAKGIPTVVVVAGENLDVLQYVQNIFSNERFRVYTSSDLVGVEIGAAVKNVIAIAAGVIDGLGFGDNTKGALLTRALVEIKRLGIVLGANEETFSGLSGLGDLITTAISGHSRNRHVGYNLGKGMKLDDITKNMVMIAEGVNTTKNIRELKEKRGVSMPITEEMYQMLFNDKEPIEALRSLMDRELKDE